MLQQRAPTAYVKTHRDAPDAMTPTSPPPPSSLNVSLGADFDRDGVVEFVEDKKLKRRWTRSFGAVFMNNNDSDEDLGEPDHSDERVNGKSDLRDLAELRVRRLPDLSLIHI